MEDENIHLRLVTPTETPAQIMEADEDISEALPDRSSEMEIVSYNDQESHHSNMVGGNTDTDYTNSEGKYIPDEGNVDEKLPEEETDADSVPANNESAKMQLLEEYIISSPVIRTGDGDRVTFLETEMKRNKSRLDGFCQELKILLVEVNIVCDWITEHFGVELIDRASQLFKHIHDLDEVEEMSQKLSLLKKGKSSIRRSARRKPVKQKRSTATVPVLLSKRKRGRGRPKKKADSDSEDSEIDGDDVVEAETEEFFEPPECLLNTDVDEEFFKEDVKPKRKRIRKRPPKKVLKTEGDEGNPVEGISEVKEEAKEEESQDVGKKKKWKSQPRNLQCEECGKILKADSSLRWHMLMHADLRPVQCTEPGCGKTFRDKSKLAQHHKIHGSEKNEKCRYCDRGFLRKKDLVVHERTHTGEKPYTCPNCLKSFNIKDHLTIHLRVHTGERPYKCPTCDKAFSQANSLRIHKKIHLKQASDYVPAPRKPRAPRKTKVVRVASEVSPSRASASPNDLDKVELEETKPPSLNEDVLDVTASTATTVEQHSSLVQTFFQAQTLNLVDPVQQAWNFVTGPNAVVTAATVTEPQQHQHHHQHPHQHHQPQHLTHQRTFHTQTLGPLSVSHLSVVQGHGGGTTFKLQPITSYHAQPQQQQSQHGQNVNIIRNTLSGQSGSFVPTHFHDPTTFRHFQN